MTVVSDNFNRANGGLGASWTDIGAVNFAILSNEAKASANGAAVAFHTTSLGGTDHKAECVIATLPANQSAGPAARCTSSTGYLFSVRNSGTATYRIYDWDGSTTNQLAVVATTPPSFPCTARIECEGTTIRGYVNDVEVISVTSSLYTTQVNGGVWANMVAGVYGTVDDFTASLLNEESITISSPAQYFTDQRDANDECDITVSGTYAGSPTTIEARFNGGTWTTLDASPSGGTYSGTLTCSAGQGAIEVRFSNSTGTTASVADIGVGDVFLVTGQSNAAGHGDNNQSYSHASLKATMYDSGLAAWTELTDPTAIADTYGSVWPLLATIIMADQSVPVAFLPMAVGGTASTAWIPGAVRYDNAIDAVTASGVTGIKAVLHHQGEADANDEVAYATYVANMELFIAGVASDCPGSPPVVLAMIGNCPAADYEPGLDVIRKAHQDLWERSDVYAGPVLYDVDLSDETGDSLHFETNTELQTLADRWGVALSGLYAGTGDVRTRATKIGKTNDTTITVFCNRTVAGASLSATPWHVTDQTGDNDVTAVVASGSTVTLTLDRALDGAATLDYVRIDESGGLNVPKATIDSIDVPLEPIFDAPIQIGSRGGGLRDTRRIRNLRI